MPLWLIAQTPSPALEMVWGDLHYKFNEKHEMTSSELRNQLLTQGIVVYDGESKLSLHQADLFLVPATGKPLEFIIQSDGVIDLKSGVSIADIDFAQLAANATLYIEFPIVEYSSQDKFPKPSIALPTIAITIKD